MFLIGLLHDIGHLFMYLGIPDHAQRAVLKARKEHHPLYQVERELVGFDYALVGGLLMKELGLPKSLRVPIAAHPEPSKAGQYLMETALLHIAVCIVQADLDAGVFGEGRFSIDPAVWEVLNLSESLCREAGQAASAQFGTMAETIIY